MRIKNLFFAIISVILFLNSTVSPAYAFTNYDVQQVYGEELNELKRKSDNFTFVNKPESERLIKCFAISDSGKIALAFDGEYAQVDVYDSSGVFLYGYTFPNRNGAFSVFFEGELLSVYNAKGRYIASFDSRGNCIKILRPRENKKTQEGYYNDFYRPATGKIGDITYTASKKIALFQFVRYDEFAVIDTLGNETVIYAISQESRFEMLVCGLFFGGLLLCFIFIVCKNKMIRAK